MSVSNTVVKSTSGYGNDSDTVYAIPFDLVDDDNAATIVKVYLRDDAVATAITETLQTISTHYTLTGGPPVTDVTMVTAPTTTQKVVIVRDVPDTQTTTITTANSFPFSALELSLDKIVAQVQQNSEKLDRVPLLRVTEQLAAPLVLPQPVASTAIGWNASADALTTITTIGDIALAT